MSRPHTPAPWHNGWGKVVDAEGKTICMVTYRKNGYNDLLLAAAPELLAALQKIDANAAESVDWIRRVARQAIAKATGEDFNS